MSTEDHDSLTRRDFLRTTAAAGLTIGAVNMLGCARLTHGSPVELTAPPIDRKIRMGFVGVGGMGSVHLQNYLHIPDVEIRTICDINEDNLKRAQDWVEEAGQPRPEGYSRGEYDFMRMCERDDLDYILTATPWRWHVPVCVAAMEAGKHAATEVPAAMYIDDCWKLVETSERTQRYCVMLENCCYNRRELAILNMVRKGALGEILHAECGYEHDLREVKFASGGEGLWRINHSVTRNGNLHPTHGLGPIAQCMDINRGDQFDYLVSMSCPSRGLQEFASKRFGPDDPRATRKYRCGDVNSTLIKTKKGLTILVKHDCNLPRPYDRINMVQGTKGITRANPDQVHFDGKGHEWEPLENYYEEFDHPLWKAMEDKFPGFGHGGMDYIEDYRMIRALRKGVKPDMDVYDAAAWSCLVELTEQSVTHGSRPVDVPDFTRGQWKTRPRLEFDFS